MPIKNKSRIHSHNLPGVSMSLSLTQGTLVTIIGEAVLQDRLIQLLTKRGVSGYTIIPAQGAGSHGRWMGDMAGYNTNIEVKTIVTSATLTNC
jgi:hypothetical protein